MEITGMFILALALSAVAAYLLGSLNFAIPVSKMLYGQDVRTMGSGNAGMTNVLRNFGKKGAALTMAGDTGKGVVAVLAARGISLLLLGSGVDTLYAAYIAGIACIVGHMFPVFFGFKGGKGVSTSLGVIVALQPVTAGILLGIFLILFGISKMVSLGSVVGIAFYPLVCWLWNTYVAHTPAAYPTVCSAIITLLIIWMHRANIKRILAGTEYKFGQKKKEEQDEDGGASEQ